MRSSSLGVASHRSPSSLLYRTAHHATTADGKPTAGKDYWDGDLRAPVVTLRGGSRCSEARKLMIEKRFSIDLPAPWPGGTFEAELVGPINYLVGPNGSGKSRFAAALLGHFRNRSLRARLLGTDRLREMANPGTIGGYFGDHFATGYAKSAFPSMRSAGEEGSGVDTVLLLEDRLDLSIQIEATLSHLFARDVVLEWDSGNLVPKVVLRSSGEAYRLDRDECHGIKELFVLLTHLYDDRHDYLIVDEPELNLHPQYQAFFMEEVRKVAGREDAAGNAKIVFLITHSPFILDLRSDDDVKSIISFDLEYSIPRQVVRKNPDVASVLVVTGRLNAHHKQLFFADDPVFVEGHHDALIVESLMEARGVSATAAGSCIIDCGGLEEVTHYLELCQALGKEAHFVYDLDSLFRGRLRSCIGDDNSISSLLASVGVGGCFAKYVGELDKLLTDLIDTLLGQSLDGELEPLGQYLCQCGPGMRREWNKNQLAKARVAVMIAIDANRTAVVSEVSQGTVEDVEGRWRTILETLAAKNIHVLPGGTIERYLPSFSGNLFDPSQEAKRNAVRAELVELQRIRQSGGPNREAALVDRFGALYEVVQKLPSKSPVDFDDVLRRHLSDYVHELQKVVAVNPDWDRDRINRHMQQRPLQKSGVVQLDSFRRGADDRFCATIGVSETVGVGRRLVDVNSNTTIGNMGEFRGADQGGAA